MVYFDKTANISLNQYIVFLLLRSGQSTKFRFPDALLVERYQNQCTIKEAAARHGHRYSATDNLQRDD